MEINGGRVPVEVLNITGRAWILINGGYLVRHRWRLGRVEEVVGAQNDGVLELETMLSSSELVKTKGRILILQIGEGPRSKHIPRSLLGIF